ncbi:arginase [Halovenus salina]|uniref:Arginase n=1 Tax=Halovenus salina TaxID=1510225 RepID=A0ABD5VYL4_9EURY|nr:arginase [Halovenus salina]
MKRTVETLGVPMDLGADRRGVDMGPSAIRYGGLNAEFDAIERSIVDGGDLSVPHPEEGDPEGGTQLGGKAKYAEETRTVCERVAQRVSAVRDDGRFPLVLGGDHSIAIGGVNGVTDGESTGVIWFDAHGDLNTPQTTPSGNIHGMPLAALLGRGVFADKSWAHCPEIDEENVAMVGLRSLDEGERSYIRDSNIHAYPISEIDQRGITAVTEEAIDAVTADTDQLYVSLDMDFLDPDEAPGVGTPVRGGVTYRESHAALEMVQDKAGDSLCGMDVVEVNPILDRENRTAELACELAASALGKRIL